jgi:hypothetical protein
MANAVGRAKAAGRSGKVSVAAALALLALSLSAVTGFFRSGDGHKPEPIAPVRIPGAPYARREVEEPADGRLDSADAGSVAGEIRRLERLTQEALSRMGVAKLIRRASRVQFEPPLVKLREEFRLSGETFDQVEEGLRAARARQPDAAMTVRVEALQAKCAAARKEIQGELAALRKAEELLAARWKAWESISEAKAAKGSD